MRRRVRDILEVGDWGVRDTEQLAAHGDGRTRKRGGDAKVLRQGGTKGRVEVGRNRAHVRQRAKQGTAGMTGTSC